MWHAIYDEENCLSQYDEDGTEHLFSEIDQSRLTKFIVKGKREIIVNTINGEIQADGTILDFGYGDNEHRLIYFRRVRRTLGDSTEPITTEYVGWQSTIQGIDGPQNIKRIIGIQEDRITIQCD